MVYVYERQAWEYKIVSRRPPAEAPLTADELNALGRDGWELVGVAAMAEQTQFYFKRVRT